MPDTGLGAGDKRRTFIFQTSLCHHHLYLSEFQACFWPFVDQKLYFHFYDLRFPNREINQVQNNKKNINLKITFLDLLKARVLCSICICPEAKLISWRGGYLRGVKSTRMTGWERASNVYYMNFLSRISLYNKFVLKYGYIINII